MQAGTCPVLVDPVILPRADPVNPGLSWLNQYVCLAAFAFDRSSLAEERREFFYT